MTAQEIIIETRRVGKAFRVTAIDVESGTEVVFQVPVSLGRRDMQRLATSKMRYVLNKEKEKEKEKNK
jgi:hypothetical protein